MPRPLLLCGLALLALFARAASLEAADESVKVGLTENMFPGQTDNSLRQSAKPFRSLLANSTGFDGEVVRAGDALKLADKIKKDEVQIGVFSGVEFAWAKERNAKLQPVVLCVNEKKTVRALLLVRADSKTKETAELRGKTLALPDEMPPHCQLFLDRKVVPQGSSAKKFFKKVNVLTDVEEALDDVVDGKEQAAVVDALAWASYRDAKPGAARKLRTLLATDPLPSPVVACQSGHFSAAQMKRLRDGLLEAKNSRRGKELLQQMRMTGFEPVPSDFDEQLAAARKAFPVPKAK